MEIWDGKEAGVKGKTIIGVGVVIGRGVEVGVVGEIGMEDGIKVVVGVGGGMQIYGK